MDRAILRRLDMAPLRGVFARSLRDTPAVHTERSGRFGGKEQHDLL